MRIIFVIGAGRSSYFLVDYLLRHSISQQWEVWVGDKNLNAARHLVGDHQRGKAMFFDLEDSSISSKMIASSDVVISMLPPSFHSMVAQHCLSYNKHLLTASYVSGAMRAFDAEARKKNLLFLNECGLDPGIDHMSIVREIEAIKEIGGELYSLESYTGGIITPESDPENPWQYKFTWNPRNVVMAGQGMATYLESGEIKLVPYQQLFKRTTAIQVHEVGWLEGYYNRDSLSYRKAYQLNKIDTLIRGTLRKQGYCKAWDVLVQLGCCQDDVVIYDLSGKTHQDFIKLFLESSTLPVSDVLSKQLGLRPDGEELKYLSWSGFFSNEIIGLSQATPAEVLLHILNKKWNLKPADKDLIVMWHRFRYYLDGERHTRSASLVVKGEDSLRTAMAKTVGLPLGIATRLLMEGSLESKGVMLPLIKEFYDPILSELAELGIAFKYD